MSGNQIHDTYIGTCREYKIFIIEKSVIKENVNVNFIYIALLNTTMG